MLAAAVVDVQRPQTADQGRHLGSGQIQHVGPLDQQLLQRILLTRAHEVAEPVRARFEHRERLRIGVLLGGVGAARREVHVDLETGVAGGLFSTAAEPASTITSASETFLPPEAEALKSCWTRSSTGST